MTYQELEERADKVARELERGLITPKGALRSMLDAMLECDGARHAAATMGAALLELDPSLIGSSNV